MAQSFEDYMRQQQGNVSSKSTAPPSTGASAGGWGEKSGGGGWNMMPTVPQGWNFSFEPDTNMYVFYRKGQSGGTADGYNPANQRWYTKTVGVNPNSPAARWRGGEKIDQLPDYLRSGGFSLGDDGSLFQDGKMVFDWTAFNGPKPDPRPGPKPDPTPPGPTPEETELERLRKEQEAEIRRLQEEAARREREAREAAERAAAERQARMTDRRGALEQAGLWGIVQDMYGMNQGDIDSYLDTGVFARQGQLADWSNEQLAPLSEDLQKNYADAISEIQQTSANSGFGDASWMRGVEGALRQQQRGLADLYGSAYDPNRLYDVLSGSPESIRGVSFQTPQSLSSFGKGLAGFSALDPTLSALVPGGMDENPMPWMTTDYKKKNPWESIFKVDDDKYKPAQGFLRALLGR